MDAQLQGDSLVLEGAFLVERAVLAGLRIERLACVPSRRAWAEALLARAETLLPRPAGADPGAEDFPGIEVLPESALADVAGYPFHRGVIAWARRPAPMKPGEAVSLAVRNAAGGPVRVLVLPELNDPENLGGCFRNAAALGCGAVLLGATGPDPLARRVLRVSMGAALTLPWARFRAPAQPALESLHAEGFTTAACVIDDGAAHIGSWNPPARLALVLGNEAFGLSAPWLDACRERITLPMRGGIDSLNLATAGALFLYATTGGR